MQIFVSRRKRAFIQRSSRSCGGVSCRPSGKKSSGRLARISNALANPFPFSRNTISSPRRKISTSLLFSRNSFGNRTAWLLPERKTRAVAIWVHSFNIYALVYTSRKGSRQVHSTRRNSDRPVADRQGLSPARSVALVVTDGNVYC